MPDDPDVVIEQPINSNKLSPDEADAYFEKIDMEEAEVRQLHPRIRLPIAVLTKKIALSPSLLCPIAFTMWFAHATATLLRCDSTYCREQHLK